MKIIGIPKTIDNDLCMTDHTPGFGSVDALLAEGRIGEITKWLNEKIHQYGSTRSPKEVIRYVCGKEVSAEPLIRYFKEKYTKVYNLG